jgi:1-phosphatidylinositol phosphodiesterase
MKQKPRSIIFTVSLLLAVALQPLRAWAAANDWMTSIGDSVLLSQLTIPGTHDSGAMYEPVSGTAKCQSLTIAQQLSAGVRFLDVRCRHYQDAFVIHHGSIYQNQNFDDVLTACQSFLTANPGETIIMSVKEEYDAYNNTRTFADTFNAYVSAYSGLFNLTSSIPTLGNSRGKIILVRRFSGITGGLAANSWGDNALFTTGSLRVQDYYQVSSSTNDNKIAAIESLFNEALAGSSGTLYLNFCSGYKSILGIPNIPSVSGDVNNWLASYFGENICNRYGIAIMDFATAALCEPIYKSNIYGTKILTNAASGLVMDASGNDNGSNVIVYSYWGGANQKWNLTYLGSNLLSIRSYQTGNKAADTWNWGTTDGTNIALYTYYGNTSQKYYFVSLGDGSYRITPSIASAQCIDANGTSNGSNVSTWTYWGGANQKWFIQNP